MTQSAKGQERYEALYKNAQDVTEKIENKAMRKQLDPPGCTFEPKFLTGAHRTSDRKNQIGKDTTEGKKRFENLYSDAKKIKEKIEKKKVMEAKPKPHEFSPQITKKAQQVMKRRPLARKKSFSSRLYGSERKTARTNNEERSVEYDCCILIFGRPTK